MYTPSISKRAQQVYIYHSRLNNKILLKREVLKSYWLRNFESRTGKQKSAEQFHATWFLIDFKKENLSSDFEIDLLGIVASMEHQIYRWRVFTAEIAAAGPFER
jgi:hypothetical protein